MLDRILSLIATIERVLGWVVALLVVTALAIVTGQFIDRHLIDVPWDAPDQFARITIIWLCFLGTALTLSEGAAIRIDLLDHVLPARFRALRDTAFELVLLALLVALAIKSWTVVKIGASQLILGTPFTADIPYSGLFVGLMLGIVLRGARLLRRAAGRLRPRTE